MPATKRTLKELRDSLKTLQTKARVQATVAEKSDISQYYRGRSDGIEACRKLVEQLCQ